LGANGRPTNDDLDPNYPTAQQAWRSGGYGYYGYPNYGYPSNYAYDSDGAGQLSPEDLDKLVGLNGADFTKQYQRDQVSAQKP
jgi:hypothetical protein